MEVRVQLWCSGCLNLEGKWPCRLWSRLVDGPQSQSGHVGGGKDLLLL